MNYFVDKESIVRKIWGKSDTILLIFAGASAEFALNKAVDWLFFTGRLPQDPLGRLFSTVAYARKIVFSEQTDAYKAIDDIYAIHTSVENKRGKAIPQWAYRDVLFMLIDYSIRAYEILEQELKTHEKEEVLKVFLEVGRRMKIVDLPENYSRFEQMRQSHLEQNLSNGEFSNILYKQYRHHLGFVRYRLLLETQLLITPETVRVLLGLKKKSRISFLISIYRKTRRFSLDKIMFALLLPSIYKREIMAMNSVGK